MICSFDIPVYLFRRFGEVILQESEAHMVKQGQAGAGLPMGDCYPFIGVYIGIR